MGEASLGEVRDTPDGSAVARINMALEEKELAVVVPGVGTKFVVVILLPELVNTVPVKKGDELLMEAPRKQKPSQYHKYKKPLNETWRTQADRSAKKPKEGFDSSGRMQL